MTKEKIKDILLNEMKCVQRAADGECNRDCSKCDLLRDDTEILEAYRLAIKVVEQKPCSDAVSRWIPVSERLPYIGDWYLGIFKEPDTGFVITIPFICGYVGYKTEITTKDFWILHGFTDRDCSDFYYELECIAWMPLPEPFEPQESEVEE